MGSNTSISVFHSSDAAEIARLVGEGFCPVECSVGGESVMDELKMDHHGVESSREGVAVRAYRDHFGARAADPRFVYTGAADADATFAIAALAGILPHSSKEVSGLPPFLQKAQTQDLTALAELVNRVDTDPIGVDLAAHPWGPVLLLWNQLTNGPQSADQAIAGIFLWNRILTGSESLKALLEATKEDEANRRQLAAEAPQEVSVPVRVVLGSPVWGFDVWYSRTENTSPNEPAGWATPIVVAFNPRAGNITLGCPNAAVAEKLFGPGGLKNVFPKLEPAGFGGREAVGGSPRGVKMTEDDARRIGRELAAMAA